MNKVHQTQELVLPELSYKVVGVCMNVHTELGNKLLEKYYQRALEIELEKQKMFFVREAPVNLEYDGKVIGKYFVDFVIENKIVLEIKAQKDDTTKFYRQILAYLKQLDIPLGIIVNFRQSSISPYRVVNSKWSGFVINSNKFEIN